MADKKSKPIVLITGSEGEIGSRLRQKLSENYQVIGLDLEGTGCDIDIDISSGNSVSLAFKLIKERYGKKIAAVIHLAAYFDFTGEPSPLYDEVNVQGTKYILDNLQEFEIERFIYSSTMLVHEPSKVGKTINESSPIGPKWVYPESKANTEKIIADNHGKIPYLILRLAGLYDEESCVPTLANQIARVYERDIKSNLYAGDLDAGQSFIHQKDLIELFSKAIDKRKQLPEESIILAGEPKVVSYKRLNRQITEFIHGEDSKITKIPKPIAKSGAWLEENIEPIVPDEFDKGEKPFIRPFMIDLASDHYALDISKAQKMLDWEPKHSIEKTLPKIIKFLKNNPDKWYEKNQVTKPDWMTVDVEQDAEQTRKNFEQKFRHLHQENLWAHFINIGLGFWLVSSPFSLGYQSNLLSVSDTVSGFALVFLALMCLSWRAAPARWGCAAIGLWLIFAPLFFWAPTAASYLNDTLVGALVIGFSVLVRPSVGVAANADLYGPTIPPGWQFSPSSWFQRLPIIILAFIGFYISRYMTAYQLDHIDAVWDPFFQGALPDAKNGTEEIITSFVSEAWPVPDAGLGAAVYILEILTGIIGGSNRWRTMPWLVLFFGIMIVPLGVVSITFIIIQPILLNTWCTLCLIAAVAMLIQVPYSFDELVATSVFLWRRWKKGRPLLWILFVGDTDDMPKDKKSDKAKDEDDFEQSPMTIIKEMLTGGITIPWNLTLCILIGLWLMFTRITLSTTGGMANADHLIGSLIITVTVTALAESVRPVRLINLIFAIALCITPFLYGAGVQNTILSIITGILLFILTIPKGSIRSTYGSWDKYIF